MGYCVHCGYNLHAHSTRDNCPECGKIVVSMVLGPLPNSLLGTVATGSVLLLPFIWLVLGSFYVLCSAILLILTFLPFAIRDWRRARLATSGVSVVFCALATTVPLLTLCLFAIVFIVGKSSNVAQLAGSGGFDYWGLWFNAWPFLFFGNPACVVAGLIALATPPYHRRYIAAWALPFACLVAAGAASHIAMIYFPTA